MTPPPTIPTALPPTGVDVSVVVPALNEAKNLPALARRVAAALAGRRYELIVVDDDSRDGTPTVAAELAASFPLRLLVRRQPTDGLSGAVLAGFGVARGDVLVVMDADLQHPPEKLPDLIAAVEAGGAEFAVGSRFVPGGSTAGAWGAFRRANSWVATALARPFAGRTHDPMSGFFALRRSTLDRGGRFAPTGYKIGLELMCKCRVSAVAEVPIHFDTRAAGHSKLTVRQQFKYLDHLSRLYDFCFPRVAPAGKAAFATGVATLVGLAGYLLLLALDVPPGAAVPAAFGAFAIAGFVFHARSVRTQRATSPGVAPWRDFAIGTLAEFCACAGSAVYLLTRGWRIHALALFGLTFGAAIVVRYAVRRGFMRDVRGLRRATANA